MDGNFFGGKTAVHIPPLRSAHKLDHTAGNRCQIIRWFSAGENRHAHIGDNQLQLLFDIGNFCHNPLVEIKAFAKALLVFRLHILPVHFKERHKVAERIAECCVSFSRFKLMPIRKEERAACR